MTSAVYQPTASQWAAAAMHLDRRDEWRTVRINGVRYVVLTSGNSGRVYFVRADARGCGCLWSQTMQPPCSHRIALELDALEADLIAARIEDIDSEIELAFAALATSKRGNGAGAAILKRYESIWTDDG
jgi:hypothetical protein